MSQIIASAMSFEIDTAKIVAFVVVSLLALVGALLKVVDEERKDRVREREKSLAEADAARERREQERYMTIAAEIAVLRNKSHEHAQVIQKLALESQRLGRIEERLDRLLEG